MTKSIGGPMGTGWLDGRKMVSRLFLVPILPGLLLLPPSGSQDQPPTVACPAVVETSDIADIEQLESWTRQMASYAPNRSGDDDHNEYVDWLEEEFASLPGVTVETTHHEPFDDVRFAEDQDEPYLSVHLPTGRRPDVPVDLPARQRPGWETWRDIATAGPATRTALTGPDGIEAKIVELQPGQKIKNLDVEGKIVLAKLKYASTPMSDFYAASTYVHDPGLTLAQREDTRPTGEWRREYRGGAHLKTLNRQATSAGAVGLLLDLGLPRDQADGKWQGQQLDLPGLFLGVHEANRLRDALADGSPVRARMTIEGEIVPHHSRSLRATLPGTTGELVAFQTHTDTVHELQENGAVALLAIAQYASRLPQECRQKTLEFELSAGHRSPVGGANPAAKRLAGERDRLALVFSLEHLGAREYLPVEQDDGTHRLEPTGLVESSGFMIPDNPVMHELAPERTIARDLRRTWVLPAVSMGEAKAFAKRDLPTAQIIAGPWTLHLPRFGIEQVDFDHMKRQILAVADVYRRIDPLPPAAVSTQVRCGPTKPC